MSAFSASLNGETKSELYHCRMKLEEAAKMNLDHKAYAEKGF